MARICFALLGGSVCGLTATALVGALWMLWGGETFIDHHIHW